MLWLLPWLAALATAGAALSGAAYLAFSRFGLLQRLLAALADRALAKVADDQAEAYAVTHTDTGTPPPPLAVAAAAACRLLTRPPSFCQPRLFVCGAACCVVHQQT